MDLKIGHWFGRKNAFKVWKKNAFEFTNKHTYLALHASPQQHAHSPNSNAQLVQ
jgi:hypothetical protein